MIKVLFICHGNICRSPLAEFVLKHLVASRGLSDCFEIASAATSMEEIGNDVHRGSKAIMNKYNIPYSRRAARRMERRDYDYYDFLIGMDKYNISNMNRLAGGDPDSKIHKLLTFAGISCDVADPWYTGDFETTYRDIVQGCEGFLQYLEECHLI